jgi:hypothetical protein
MEKTLIKGAIALGAAAIVATFHKKELLNSLAKKFLPKW